LGVSSSNGGVALFEHIGGFIAGVVVGLIVRGFGAGGRPRSVRSSDGVGVG
jgi:membrane associated rhomboid family serine protease